MQVLRMLRVAAAAAVACASVANAAIDLSGATATTPAPAVPTESPIVDILSAAGNATDLPGGNALCSADQRVRRPWGALDEDDQALYLEAMALAVENGALKQFADLYADEASGAQASFSSAFFLWHRRLVLGFESYLRDLDPKFACLTIPFYDIHTAYVRSASQECGSLIECSAGFFEALSDDTVIDTTAPARNDLTSIAVPASAGFTTFQRLIASTSDYASFLEGIQFGLHNDMRDAVGGAIATFASPRDPVFYSWHAALDMYLHTYQLCRIGVPLSEDDFKNSTLVFPSASDETGGVPGVDANSKLLFSVTVDGSTVDIADHPTLGKYFASVGTDVWHYGDVQQLGDYSYTYELPEVLRQQLLTNSDVCTGFARAFAATSNVKTTLSTAAKTLSTKSTNVTTTKTVTTTTIRNGTKYTTTTTTKTSVRRNVTTKTTSKNSTSTTSTLKSFFSKLTSRFGYIFDLSGDDDDDASASTFAVGTDVTNGYVGYKAYDATGVLTTKHSGLVVADIPTGAASTINRTKTTKTTTTTTTTTKKYKTKTDAAYRNVSTVQSNVTVNGVASMRDVSASVATAGAYWRWLAAAYDGLKIRFEGNIDLVAQHLELLELQAYANSFGGIRNYSASFVQSLGLTSARSLAGQTVDDIASGKVVLAAASSNLSAKAVTFSNASVIKTLTTTYKRIVTRRRTTTYLNVTYIKKAEAAIKQAMAVLVTKEATATKNGSSTATATATATIAGGNTSTNSTKTVVAGGVKVTSNTTTVIGAGGNASTTTTSTETIVQLTPAPASTTKAPSTKAPTNAPVATTTTIAPAATTTVAPSTTAPTTGASTAPAVTPATGGTTVVVTVSPAATPAASGTKPAATPAASTTKPASTPAASSTKPAATPAASVPVAPVATPAASATKPAVTPAASAPKPAVTPAASNIIKVVVTPAPTSPKLIC